MYPSSIFTPGNKSQIMIRVKSILNRIRIFDAFIDDGETRIRKKTFETF